MAKLDFVPYNEGISDLPGSTPHQVVSGTTASINIGEIVLKTLGNQYVTLMATNKPVVATDFMAGIAAGNSTETASANGVVQVYPIFKSDASYLCTPTVAATWNTQAKYNALIGARVLVDVTGGVETILATDGATNGLVVEPLDILKYPNKVRVSFRAGLNYLA